MTKRRQTYDRCRARPQNAHLVADLARGRVELLRQQRELRRQLEELLERRLHLVALLEELLAAEDVQPEARARHGDDEAADVAEVAHDPRAHEREQHVVVLLPLELVHRRHLRRRPEQRVPRASPRHHVPDEVLLAPVRRDDADLARRVAQQPHVLEHRHDVLSLPEILGEVRRRLELALALKVRDVDELELVREPGVAQAVLALLRALQVAQAPAREHAAENPHCQPR